jgi:outer membrane protein
LKTRSLKGLFILAAVMLLFTGKSTYAQNFKFGFVDSEIILKQLPESQKVQKDIEALQKLYVDSITTRETTLKSKAENFRTRYDEAQKRVESGQVKSESELKSLNEEIGNLQKEVQDLNEALDLYKQKIQNELVQRQSEMFKPVKDKITAAIESLAKAENIQLIVDKADGNVLYADKKYDLTFKVLDKLK